MVILADSSAWIDFLRGTATPAADALDAALGRELAVTGPVVLEVLAGARPGRDLERSNAILRSQRQLPVEPQDWNVAATIHRRCRAAGETVRSRFDVLIAAVAIRHDVPVLHRDRDFDVIARHTELRTV